MILLAYLVIGLIAAVLVAWLMVHTITEARETAYRAGVVDGIEQALNPQCRRPRD